MISTKRMMCFNCARRKSHNADSFLSGPNEKIYCEAYPKKIPDAIKMGFDHRKPYSGDHGIRYTPKHKEK
jgi:hypothetical protein